MQRHRHGDKRRRTPLTCTVVSKRRPCDSMAASTVPASAPSLSATRSDITCTKHGKQTLCWSREPAAAAVAAHMWEGIHVCTNYTPLHPRRGKSKPNMAASRLIVHALRLPTSHNSSTSSSAGMHQGAKIRAQAMRPLGRQQTQPISVFILIHCCCGSTHLVSEAPVELLWVDSPKHLLGRGRQHCNNTEQPGPRVEHVEGGMTCPHRHTSPPAIAHTPCSCKQPFSKAHKRLKR
jgi:hypothetical protein